MSILPELIGAIIAAYILNIITALRYRNKILYHYVKWKRTEEVQGKEVNKSGKIRGLALSNRMFSRLGGAITP